MSAAPFRPPATLLDALIEDHNNDAFACLDDAEEAAKEGGLWPLAEVMRDADAGAGFDA